MLQRVLDSCLRVSDVFFGIQGVVGGIKGSPEHFMWSKGVFSAFHGVSKGSKKRFRIFRAFYQEHFKESQRSLRGFKRVLW